MYVCVEREENKYDKMVIFVLKSSGGYTGVCVLFFDFCMFKNDQKFKLGKEKR